MKYLTLTLATSLLLVPMRLTASNPPVRLRLSDQSLARGQPEKVHVRTAEDGYLVVLRTDTKGDIRVLYPVNPTDDDAIQGGHNVELRGRGDRDAFAAFEQPGSGSVLAAWAPAPFDFAEFTTNGHWKRAGIVADSSGTDATDAMLVVVDRMATGPYKYDVMPYTVGKREDMALRNDWYDPWYNPWYDPWFPPMYDSWYYGPYGGWGWAPLYYVQPPVYVPRPGRVEPERVEPHERGR